MNTTNSECYISEDHVELAKTIAVYVGISVFTLCSCLVARCCCKRPECCHV